MCAESLVRNTTRPKYALVIGVGEYEDGNNLHNPKNDAESIAQTLDDIGFKVKLYLDPDVDTIQKKVTQFTKMIPPGAKVVLFYAGHGCRHKVYYYLKR